MFGLGGTGQAPHRGLRQVLDRLASVRGDRTARDDDEATGGETIIRQPVLQETEQVTGDGVDVRRGVRRTGRGHGRHEHDLRYGLRGADRLSKRRQIGDLPEMQPAGRVG